MYHLYVSKQGGRVIGEDGVNEKDRTPAAKWGFNSVHLLKQVSRESWLGEMGSRGWRLFCKKEGGSGSEPEYTAKHDRLVYYNDRKEIVSVAYYQPVGNTFNAHYYIAPKGAVVDDSEYARAGTPANDTTGMHIHA